MIEPRRISQIQSQTKVDPEKSTGECLVTSAGVIHYSFLRCGHTITADVCCQQLQTMMEKLVIKQPRLVNLFSPLLLQDNARRHTARLTAAKLRELRLECLRYPPYFSELAPADYHFF